MKTPVAFHAAMLACLNAALPSTAAVHYVDVNSTNPIAPYTNCAAAATVIQDAIGGALGGRLFDCTLLANSANRGGGAALASLRRCTIAGNSAVEYGGGDFLGTLDNCILTGDFAGMYGGGSRNGTLVNCTISGNSAGEGAGGVLFWNEEVAENCAPMGLAWNCIVYYNTDPWGAANWGCDGFLSYCCTTPLPLVGLGNITNAPSFVDAAARNFRLPSNSPCINAGQNAGASAGPDLDGNPRIVGGTVDMCLRVPVAAVRDLLCLAPAIRSAHRRLG